MENGDFTLCFIVYACSLSRVRLFVTPWTLAHQAPLSMEFFRREYWSGLPFSSLLDLPKPGIESESLQSPALTARFFTTAPHRSGCFIDENFKTQKHWVFDVVVVQFLSRVWLFTTPGLPVPHHLPEFAQVHFHWISVSIQPSHLLSPSSPFAFNLCQQRSLFQWVGSLHHVAKVLELQLQHQSFQWIFRVNFL